MRTRPLLTTFLITTIALSTATGRAVAEEKKAPEQIEDPFADLVWPPPPDEPRIKLEAVITGRPDVEGKSRLKKLLLGATAGAFDNLVKPFGVAFDSRNRILVTDQALAAVLRFDREGERMDVFGTRGGLTLAKPMGLSVGPDDMAYVADAAQRRVLAFDAEGEVTAAYGRSGELTNPTDAAVSPAGSRLYVADSKAHRIVVFDVASGELLEAFGERGSGDGQFNFPTSLAVDPEGNLLVVDQANARVQVLSAEGDFIDSLGSRGTGFGQFARPKDVAVDEVGFIYVTDYAFNNVQLFDADFTLLTFVGQGGTDPGQFVGASGVAARGDEFAVVDQVGRRLQVFRFIVPKSEG